MIDDTKQTEEVQEATEAQAPGLSINDLANIKQIVEVAQSRGAFKADELEVVGGVYNRLTAFLVSVTPAQDAEATEETEATDETAEA